MATIVRPPGVKAVNLSLEVEAWELVKKYAPSTKAYGHYLSRLVYEDEARRQGQQAERERLLARRQAADAP